MKSFISERLMKIIVVLTAFSMIITAAVPAKSQVFAASAAKSYKDVAGHQYEEALLYVIENGIMSNDTSYIYPDNILLKGEACLSLNALLGATVQYDMSTVKNLKPDSRYYDAVAAGLNAGYLVHKDNGDVYNPLVKANYKYIADIFTSVLGIDMKEEIYGTHKGNETLTKGEFAAILLKLAPNIVTKSTSKSAEGDVYVQTANIILSNMTVGGNLIITDAVADQEITLKNVNVKGKLIVRGGGANSVILMGTSSVEDIIVKQMNNKVRVKVYNQSDVSSVFVGSRSNDVIIEGSFKKIEAAGEGVNVNAVGAKLEDVVISGAGAKVIIGASSAANNVEIIESATAAELIIEGRVEALDIAAKNVNITLESKSVIAEINAVVQAANLNIEVAKNAVVNSIISKAEGTLVDGEGSVKKAEISKSSSEVKPYLLPTSTPTSTPSPTLKPTASPTSEPTASPTSEPTASPTSEPTASPTSEPTATPTSEPTASPTSEPTATPTLEPSASPTAEPTASPTLEPTASPTSEPTASPTAEPTPVVEVTSAAISGTANVGKTLTASANEGATNVTYQWYRNVDRNNTSGTIIDGETGSTYMLSMDDKDKYIYVVISGDNGSKVASKQTVMVMLVIEVTTATVTGTPMEGNILRAAANEDATSASYQWYTNSIDSNEGGIPIVNEAKSYLTLRRSEACKYVYVVISGANSSRAVSEPVLVKGKVEIKGSAVQGQELTTDLNYEFSDSNITYTWYRNNSPYGAGTEIPDANKSTYTLTVDDVGYYIYVVVNTSNANAQSVAVGAVTAE